MALGDFDFGASFYLPNDENILYWLIWLLVVIITCIIFLNFIIAEASASYQKVKDNLQGLVNKERGSMIAEAESMYIKELKNPIRFPKYLVIRRIDI